MLDRRRDRLRARLQGLMGPTRRFVKRYGPAAVIGYAALSVGMYIPIFLFLRQGLHQGLSWSGPLAELGPGAAALLINRMLRPIRVGILIAVLPRLSKRWVKKDAEKAP